MTTQELRFENIGMGCSIAADWFTVNGQRLWIDFSSASEGSGKRRTWHVIANHYGEDRKPNRVTVSKKNCFRYEAVQVALEELSKWLAAQPITIERAGITPGISSHYLNGN